MKILNVFLPNFKKKLWLKFYNTVGRLDKNKKIFFMNYGIMLPYQLELKNEDKVNQYRIQLYHYLLKNLDTSGKSLIEIGCGRGGGCSYYSRYFSLEKITGIDLSAKNILICKENFGGLRNIEFKEGDAENLDVPSSSYDFAINLESSHCYPIFLKFAKEVFRVLKPKGRLGFADFVLFEDVEKIKNLFIQSGFKILEFEDISQKVLDAILIENKNINFSETNHFMNINLRKLTGASKDASTGIVPALKNNKLCHIYLMLEK